jgi:hypothetical protein
MHLRRNKKWGPAEEQLSRTVARVQAALLVELPGDEADDTMVTGRGKSDSVPLRHARLVSLKFELAVCLQGLALIQFQKHKSSDKAGTILSSRDIVAPALPHLHSRVYVSGGWLSADHLFRASWAACPLASTAMHMGDLYKALDPRSARGWYAKAIFLSPEHAPWLQAKLTV